MNPVVVFLISFVCVIILFNCWYFKMNARCEKRRWEDERKERHGIIKEMIKEYKESINGKE